MASLRKHVDFQVPDWGEIATAAIDPVGPLRAVRFTLRPTTLRPGLYRPARYRPEAVGGLFDLDPERLRPLSFRSANLRPNNLRPQGGADLVALAQLGQVNQTFRPTTLRDETLRPGFFRPQPGSGLVAMHQRPESAFPDRPPRNLRNLRNLPMGNTSPMTAADDEPIGAGVRLILSAGSDGRYVEHTLPTPAAVLHNRFLIAPGTAAGGRVVVTQGLDDTGGETFRIAYDTVTQQAIVTLATGDTLAGTLPAGLAWHCVEVKIDTDTDEAELWVNGVSVDTVTASSGALASLTTRTVRFGALFKDPTFTGQLSLDEWLMDDAYAGPVVVDPTFDHAGDPARWAVVYNTASSDSVTWVEEYRQARAVPFANLIGVSTATTEAIDATQWTNLRDAVAGYLSRNGLDDSASGIVVGYGVPGVADVGGDTKSVASLLTNLTNDSTDLANANYLPGLVDITDLPDRASLTSAAASGNGPYMVAEMNAPTLTDALALIDRASTLTTITPAGHAITSLDPNTDQLATATTPGDWASLTAWIGTVEAQQVKLPPPPPGSSVRWHRPRSRDRVLRRSRRAGHRDRSDPRPFSDRRPQHRRHGAQRLTPPELAGDQPRTPDPRPQTPGDAVRRVHPHSGGLTGRYKRGTHRSIMEKTPMTEPFPPTPNGRIALFDRVVEFTQTVGLPGVLLIGILWITWQIADRYLDHTIEMETRERAHRMATEQAMQQMLGHTLTEFLQAHQEQSRAVVGIHEQLKLKRDPR